MSRRDGWRFAVLGATGAVGRQMLDCMERSGIPVRDMAVLASPRSAGARVRFGGRDLEVRPVCPEAFDGVDCALFSAGAAASEEWAPVAVSRGAWVVDNSSRWRMDPRVALIVPEVNADALPAARAIVANPNCSTIQMVVALEAIRRRFGLRRVTVSTYQSASGKGQTGLSALDEERAGRTPPPVFPKPLLGNVIPQCDAFLDDGFTREEVKMIEETRKILRMPDLPVHPTCVRVPVAVAHSEAVLVQTGQPADAAAAREALAAFPGVRVLDEPGAAAYPTPLEMAGTDAVWVGRVRVDRCDPHGLHLWIVSDNLRKGAALNAVQIAQELVEREAGSS